MGNDGSAQERLKRHNPYAVRLFDREDGNFQFFDGGSKLVALPMSQFDGYPLENEYRFFIPFSMLVVIGTVLPLLPLYVHGSTVTWTVTVYLIGVLIMGIWTVFHLMNIRTIYIAANSTIHNTDLASKAEAIRGLIHTFKSIVRWRRFMRYSMNLGLTLLTMVAAWVVFFKPAHAGLDYEAKFTSMGLFVLSAALFWLFELGRRALTEGMDPTLALVHMVEELGHQLLARGQVIVRNG